MPLGETADCVARNAIGTSQEGQAMSAKLKAPKKKKEQFYKVMPLVSFWLKYLYNWKLRIVMTMLGGIDRKTDTQTSGTELRAQK